MATSIDRKRVAELQSFETPDDPYVEDLLLEILGTAREASNFIRANLQNPLGALGSKAHSAKGSCLNAGFVHLASIFENIEDAAQRQDLAEIKRVLVSLPDGLSDTTRELSQILGRPISTPQD